MRNVDGVNPVCYVIEIKHIAFTIYITHTVTDTHLMCIHLFDFWEILLLLEFGWVLMDKVYYETYDTVEAVYDTMEQNPTRDMVPSVSQII